MKTKVIVLVLSGASLVSACGREDVDHPEQRINGYATKEDCIADWGNKCNTGSTTTAIHGNGTAVYPYPYYGPAYSGTPSASSGFVGKSGGGSISSFSSGSGSSSSSSSAVGSTRGGFGATGHSVGISSVGG